MSVNRTVPSTCFMLYSNLLKKVWLSNTQLQVRRLLILPDCLTKDEGNFTLIVFF